MAVFACAAVCAVEPVQTMPAGGQHKKHIGLLFDVMKTTPSNVLANADKFAEHAPYLDGVALSLNNVIVPGEGGSVVTTGLSEVMSGTVRWTRDSVKDQIPVLREIAKKPHLKESFLLQKYLLMKWKMKKVTFSCQKWKGKCPATLTIWKTQKFF